VVTAGILHDTIEDTPTSLAEIHERFGTEVAELVDALTADPAIEGFDERKAALRRQISEFGPDATSVYAADKVTKVRELIVSLGTTDAVIDPAYTISVSIAIRFLLARPGERS
jgi:(p)ppGpp synthase/HD superfamily hydrolase